MATPDAPQAFFYTWNSVDTTGRMTGWGVTKSVNVVEETYGDTGDVSRAPGAADHQHRITPGMDDSAHVSSLYWFSEVGTERAFVARPNDAAQGSGNPEAGGNAFISEHSFDFEAGGDASQSLTLAVNGAITYAEA